MNQYEMKQRAYQSNLKSRALQVLLYLEVRGTTSGYETRLTFYEKAKQIFQ